MTGVQSVLFRSELVGVVELTGDARTDRLGGQTEVKADGKTSADLRDETAAGR